MCRSMVLSVGERKRHRVPGSIPGYCVCHFLVSAKASLSHIHSSFPAPFPCISLSVQPYAKKKSTF